jgi:Reverse transcriptase (RNA-dependent DNA polymerase)
MSVFFLIIPTMTTGKIQGVPLQHLNGHTPDIIVLLRFHFWKKVYYQKVDSHFPSDSTESLGHIVGISDHCGHALTYKVFNPSTQKVIHCSLIPPAVTSDPNLCVELLGGESKSAITPVIHSCHDDMLRDSKQPSTQDSAESTIAPIINPEELIGRTFLLDNQKFHARIVKPVDDHTSQLENDKDRMKILLSLDEDSREEVITYYLARDNDNDIVWKFKRIVSHQGSIASSHPDYNGPMYNLLIEWKNGETTKEPLQVIDMRNLCQRTWATRFFRLEAVQEDAIALELQQINEYEIFTDLRHHTKAKIPNGYKNIRAHFVFDVKHDGCQKSRLVADGHLTEVPLEYVYSGVVSLRGFRLVLFLEELNILELWATDIGNAYLEAFTSELVYIIAGPEFKELEGHVLLIFKVLYGLSSSGARWHDRFVDCISQLCFFPRKAEPDIWMRKLDDMYA